MLPPPLLLFSQFSTTNSIYLGSRTPPTPCPAVALRPEAGAGWSVALGGTATWALTPLAGPGGDLFANRLLPCLWLSFSRGSRALFSPSWPRPPEDRTAAERQARFPPPTGPGLSLRKSLLGSCLSCARFAAGTAQGRRGSSPAWSGRTLLYCAYQFQGPRLPKAPGLGRPREEAEEGEGRGAAFNEKEDEPAVS